MFLLLSGTPTYHLPPVKNPTGSKKKSSKHCFLCGKKTGLATSYECRYKCLQHFHLRSHTPLPDSKSNLTLFVILILEVLLLVESGLFPVHNFVSQPSLQWKRVSVHHLFCHKLLTLSKFLPHDINLDHIALSGLVQGAHTESDATVCNFLTQVT